MKNEKPTKTNSKNLFKTKNIQNSHFLKTFLKLIEPIWANKLKQHSLLEHLSFFFFYFFSNNFKID